MSLFFPVGAKLKDGLPVQLVLEDEQDVELLRRLYRVIVGEGVLFSEQSECPAAGAESCLGVQSQKGAGARAVPATLVRGGLGHRLVVE